MGNKRKRKLAAHLSRLRDKFVDLANDLDEQDPELCKLIDEWLYQSQVLCGKLADEVR